MPDKPPDPKRTLADIDRVLAANEQCGILDAAQLRGMLAYRESALARLPKEASDDGEG